VEDFVKFTDGYVLLAVKTLLQLLHKRARRRSSPREAELRYDSCTRFIRPTDYPAPLEVESKEERQHERQVVELVALSTALQFGTGFVGLSPMPPTAPASAETLEV
jgi:hypothetical protein